MSRRAAQLLVVLAVAVMASMVASAAKLDVRTQGLTTVNAPVDAPTTTSSTSTTSTTSSTSTTSTTSTTTSTTTPPAATAPAFGGVGTAAFRTSSGDLTVQYPTGTAPGDLVLLVQSNAANQKITTPSGWTLLADQATSSPSQLRFTVWWRQAGTEQNVLVEVNTNSSGTSLWVVRYAKQPGAADIAPAHTAVRQGVAGSVASITPSPDVTTTGPATVISLTTVRAPNPLSLAQGQQFNLRSSATSSGGIRPTIGVADRSVAGAQTTPSPTWAQTGTPAQWAWTTVAFR